MISSFSDQNDIIQNYSTKFKKVVQKQFINPLTTAISLCLKISEPKYENIGEMDPTNKHLNTLCDM